MNGTMNGKKRQLNRSDFSIATLILETKYEADASTKKKSLQDTLFLVRDGEKYSCQGFPLYS